MYPLIISTAVVSALAIGSYMTISSKNEELKNQILKAKELQTAQKLDTQNNKEKIKLSSLVEDTNLSSQKKENLDNFQKAINVAVIDNNIDNPTCNDLVATGYITLSKCQEIKNSSNNYAKVQNGEIEVSNTNIIKIIKTQTGFTKETQNIQKATTSIRPLNSKTLEFQRNKIKQVAKQNAYIQKNIATTNDTDLLQKIGKAIIEKEDIKKTILRENTTTQDVVISEKNNQILERIKNRVEKVNHISLSTTTQPQDEQTTQNTNTDSTTTNETVQNETQEITSTYIPTQAEVMITQASTQEDIKDVQEVIKNKFENFKTFFRH